MERTHCEEGSGLQHIYLDRVQSWVDTEVEKRAIVTFGTPDEFAQASRRAEQAQALHAEAQQAYIDHLVACQVCSRHAVPARVAD